MVTTLWAGRPGRRNSTPGRGKILQTGCEAQPGTDPSRKDGRRLNLAAQHVHPRTGHEGLDVEYRYSATLSLTSALDGICGQRHATAVIYPRERPGTHCTGGWVGPRAGLDRCGKSRPPPGLDPRRVQPVASRYTD